MSNSSSIKTEKSQFNYESESRAWIECSPVCTKIVDLDFNLQYMSSAGVESLNIDDITTFYGAPYPFNFYPESFKEQMNKNLKVVKETCKVVNQIGSVVDINKEELWFNSTLIPMKKNGELDSIMIVSLEITDQKRAEFALIKLNEELKSNVTEKTNDLKATKFKLKTLEDTLSICGYCKSIRNKEGSWDVLEKYIMENSTAQLSHGICPDCISEERYK